MKLKEAQYLAEIPYVEISTANDHGQKYLDLEFEKETEEYNHLARRHDVGSKKLQHAEMNAKSAIKQKMLRILSATKEKPFKDKHDDMFYVSDEDRVKDIMKFYHGCMNQPFHKKLVEWTPMIFSDAVNSLYKTKKLTETEKDIIINHIDKDLKSRTH